jgi:hypothetical protein
VACEKRSGVPGGLDFDQGGLALLCRWTRIPTIPPLELAAPAQNLIRLHDLGVVPSGLTEPQFARNVER